MRFYFRNLDYNTEDHKSQKFIPEVQGHQLLFLCQEGVMC